MSIRVVLLAVMVLCLFPVPVIAQTLEQAMFSMQKAIGDLELGSEKTPKPSSDASSKYWRQTLSSIQNNTNTIFAASVNLPVEERAQYAGVLLWDAEMLRKAGKQENSDLAQYILTQIDDDLKIKVSARAGMGMASRFNGRVNVNVVTMRSGKIVSGLVIVLNPWAYTGSVPFARFEKLSSPSSGSVPPGRYYLITMQDGKQISKESVDIGLNAQDNITMEVQIP